MANIREESRGHIYGNGSVETVNAGSLQRIADATELMAKNHAQLIADRDWYEKRWNEEKESGQRMARRITALKGVITKLKRGRK